MMILGGYWVTLPVLRNIAQKLEMDLGEDTVPNTGNYPRYVNNWLYDHKLDNTIPNVKAGGVDWPLGSMQFGVIFVSKFVRKQYFVPLEEDAEDLKVKAWLEGVGADMVQWATLEDTTGMTLDGTQPQKRTWTYRVVPVQRMIDEYRAYCKANPVVYMPEQ